MSWGAAGRPKGPRGERSAERWPLVCLLGGPWGQDASWVASANSLEKLARCWFRGVSGVRKDVLRGQRAFRVGAS